ncbi:MAG: aspartate aminotransferase family protein [Thermodesulfatator sp.]|nr:MAG: aspartate aminotransferase family protein [Thermodesulfatator sp.]
MDSNTRTPFDCVAETYSRFDLTIAKGYGTRLWDENGREFIDFTSGIAVCSLGHCHPRVVASVKEQAQKLFHISNLYWTEPQLKVACSLVKNSCTDRVFFCNSGAEAVEAAIKLARKFGHETRGPDCYEIITLQGSFHGRTLAAITATGQPVYQRGFEPLPSGFTHVKPDDIYSLRLAAGERTAAIMLEPIQGEGGVRPLTDEFLKAAREIADSLGALLIFDEIQVGMGRTGSLFAYEQTPVEPDVICLAKGLANGVPIGAMLAREKAMKHLGPGSHASTFGANPLACAAAGAVLDELTETDLLDQVKEKGDYLQTRLKKLASRWDKVVDVRGRGLIQAMEFSSPQMDLAKWLMEKGFLVLVAQGLILRLLPPFVVEKDEIDLLINALEEYMAR